jgi:mevalonate pyrophosphate decarboxylase
MACCTVDAGANVHVICPQAGSDEIASRLRQSPGVKEVLVASAGGPASLIEETRHK